MPELPIDVIAEVARAHTAGLVAVPAAKLARKALDEQFTVLIVPPAAVDRPWHGRLGVGYDGSRGAEAALAFARDIAEKAGEQIARVDIAYVDDSASAACESQDGVIGSRRAAMFEWWLRERSGEVPAPVRPVRPIGDAADELAELSRELDLLVIGSHRRHRFWRALSTSVSQELIDTTRCPLLVVPPTVNRPGGDDRRGYRAASPREHGRPGHGGTSAAKR
jgi:nucleotide-binding universal stress UspA family protein